MSSWVLIILACLQFINVFHVNALFLPRIEKLPLPAGEVGPYSYGADSRGRIYTGVENGTIFRFEPSNGIFTPFATTAPFRTQRACTRPNVGDLGPICSRPLAIQFYDDTQQLYIAGGTSGLLVVGPNGGPASLVANNISGSLFNSVAGVDVDQSNGVVYFTDAGSIFRKTRNISRIISSGDTSGKLLKYDPSTNQVTQLFSGMAGPTGVAVSSTGSYLLVAESLARRIQRFWLTGPRRNTLEIFRIIEGIPVGIERTPLGDFWVAVNVITEPTRVQTMAQRLSQLSIITLSVNLTEEYNTVITEVYEYLGRLYIGSLDKTFVGRVRYLL